MQQTDPLPLAAVWCAVPVFNNRETVRQVVAACREILPHVVVVDDGSSDADLVELLSGLDVVVLQHSKNLGKGQAILTASHYIEAHGGEYMITIDADGQHLPQDIHKFLPLLREEMSGIIIGCRDFTAENVPDSSRFGRSFANFWLMVETGKDIGDCQSGFRAYPVRYLNQISFRGAHYDFEAEVLAKAAWGGLALATVDIGVIYPKPEQRVSSFRPYLDNLRLTGIHAMLVGRRMLPIGHRKLLENRNTLDHSFLRHPGKVLGMLLGEHATREGLALSAAVGMFIAVLPLLFLHSVVAFYFSTRFNLNKIVTLNIQQLAVPPFIPLLCIEVGHYLRHGRWLTEFSFATLCQQISSRCLEWLTGSLIIAPPAALLTGAVMYVAAILIKKGPVCSCR